MTPHDLLEQYLRALRQNPDAQPPPELNRELAAFARQLIRTSAHPALGARSRVWGRVLLAQRQNGTPPSPYKEHTMSTQSATRTQPRAGYLLLAAVAILMVGFVALLTANLRSPMTETPLNAALQGNLTVTPTPVPTQTMPPTFTATYIYTPTPIATATYTPTPAPIDANGMVTGELMPTLIPPDMTNPMMLPPTAVPILAIPPAETIDITPYHFGADENAGRVEGALSPSAAAIAYRFTADRVGMVFAELKSSDMTLVGMSFNVTRADSSGGSGGVGGGSMGGSGLLLVQGQTIRFGVGAGDQVEIIVGSTYGYADRTLPYLLRVVLNDVIDLSSTAYEGVSENRLDSFANPLALYRFEGTAGDIVTIRATGVDGFDTHLDLLDMSMLPMPDIGRSSDQDGGPGYDAEIFRYGLPYTGAYHVLVSPGSVGYGAFRLETSHLERPSLDNGAQSIRLNSPIAPALRMTGSAGETVTINLHLPDGARDFSVDTASLVVLQGDLAIAVYDLQAAMPVPDSGVILTANVTLPADGEYIVRVSANGILTQPSLQEFVLEVSLAR